MESVWVWVWVETSYRLFAKLIYRSKCKTLPALCQINKRLCENSRPCANNNIKSPIILCWVVNNERFLYQGFPGCPGRVPLVASGQCRSHRIYARVKSKMEAAREQGPENIWSKAVNNVKNLTVANEFSRNVRNSHCRKECCSSVWLPSQRVANELS